MNESSKQNFDIAHLGQNFWKKLTNEHKSNSFLLCLDDDGRLLDHFPLGDGVSYYSSLLRACLSLGKISSKASTLIRIQSRPKNRVDPFEISSTHTKALYEIAEHHKLHLTEVTLPQLFYSPAVAK